MKVYLAGRFRDREYFKEIVLPDLYTLGVEVTSRWINWLDDPAHEHTFDAVRNENLPEEEKVLARGSWSEIDLQDIVSAEFVIHFTQPPRSGDSRGGRHFESGFAYGLGKPLFVVGPREHNFYSLPSVSVWPDWDMLYKYFSAQRHQGNMRRVILSKANNYALHHSA